MFPEFGNIRRKPLITFRRRPIFKEEEPKYLQEPPQRPQTRQQRTLNNDPFTFTTAPPSHPTSSPSSSSTTTNSSLTDKEEEEEEDIFAFPAKQSEEVKLMIARAKDTPPPIIPIPKKKSSPKPKQNKPQKQNKVKPKGKASPSSQAVNKQQHKRPTPAFDIFDYPPAYPSSSSSSSPLNTGYSKSYHNNNNSKPPSTHLFNNRVTISSLLDSSSPINTTCRQQRPSIIFRRKPLNFNNNNNYDNNNNNTPLPEKTRKRKLVDDLKAATGETPDHKLKSFSDDDIDDEITDIEAPKPISTANALRSLSPELTYNERMEKQLNDIMQSEFKQEEEEEVPKIERKRYEPLSHRNVRVTFKRTEKKQEDNDIEYVNHLISVIKDSQQ